MIITILILGGALIALLGLMFDSDGLQEVGIRITGGGVVLLLVSMIGILIGIVL